MFVYLKTGYDTDMGLAWISRVRFSKTCKTAYWQGRTLGRWNGVCGNFVDVGTGEEFWLSGPRRDRRAPRNSNVEPESSEDVRETYQAFLDGELLVGRERK